MTIADEHDVLIDRLRLAQEIVDNSEVKADLRPAAFAEIVRVLDGRGVERQQRTAHKQRRPARISNSDSARLAAVADALGIDASVVEQVFADDDGELKFVLPARRLSSTTRGAMRQIAILTACARQAGGWDESWTSAATIRAMCESVNVYQSKHFNTVVGGLDVFSVQGSGSGRQLRAHAGSFKAGRDVLKELGVLNDDAED
jgi:hypothetical protein